MPKITQHNVIDITPEKFINSCSRIELIELDLLLGSALARLDSKDSGSTTLPANTFTLLEILKLCLTEGVPGAPGISLDVQNQINELINYQD